MEQLLLVFITVVEKENFTRAADELHITHPAVSQHIQQLEQTIGTRLLDRSNKFVRLNKAGEIVYHHAKEILGIYTRMQCLVDDLMNHAIGNLSIGASYTYGEYILPHVIAYMNERYPLIKPTITIANTKEIEELVAGHQLDIGIIEGGITHKDLYFEAFAEDSMFIVVSANHRFINEKDLQFSRLMEEMWIAREEGSGTREAIEKLFSEFQLRPEKIMEFGSTQIIKEAVEAGLGISLLSQWAVRKELALGTLQILQLPELPFLRQFSFITQKTPFKTKALEIFIEVLRKNKKISNIMNDITLP
ncbi:transcriptional regulator [Heyndrickxia ginsengihumi]|uniref:Transcriptional regulator n=1 Tax=Heyndrickxia ginsengihumi TaxID=363870 RepID=A0A0A6XZ21_9BACI|nr:LysR family transcriptional regulator [Heyndrickxia ginsengihumi]KHD85352.1 transcriptional regulator [Heyndrickxia ginsengihumi]